MRRYPLAPLAAAAGQSEHTFLQRFRLGGSTMAEYRSRGLTVRVADRLATSAGFHPAEVWPTWVTDALDDHGRRCERPACSERYIPIRRAQRFCSPSCRRAEEKRRYYRRRYADEPAFRERRLEVGRQWYQDCGDYARAAQRRRDQRRAAERRVA